MESRRMCPHCRAFITTSDRVCPYCNEPVGVSVRQQTSGWRGFMGSFIPKARFVTMLILLVNAGLYLATAFFSMRSRNGGDLMQIDGYTLLYFGGKVVPLIAQGEYWRLVTAGFLHGGLMHIAMNSWVLFDLGAQVEEIYGPNRMWVIYFIATVAGFALSCWWSMHLSIGASAGIMGLIGAMIALGVRHRSALGDAIRGMYTRWAVYTLIIGLLPGLAIDNAAHIGGLAAGFAVGYVAGLRGYRKSTEFFWQASAYVCLLLTAYCFLKMYLQFSARVS